MLRLCSASNNHNRFRNFCKRLPRTLSQQQLSSLVPPTNDHADKKGNDDSVTTLLYQRDPKRNTLPRSAFLVSSLNSIYWVWYVVDFVPALNASPIDNFHVDPIYGFGGLGLSILIQSAFTLYPLSLVSKIAYRAPASNFSSNSDDRLTKKKNNTTLQKQQQILLWKHTLPLLRTSSKPLIFPVGGITMDKTSETTRTILEDLGGNIGKFEGHLGLKKVSNKKMKNGDGSSSLVAKFPLVVDIRNPSEVYDSELMLHSLLSRRIKHYNNNGIERSRSVEQSDTKDRNRFHQQRSKYQKTKRHRGKR
jgi:hypothetical protein